MTRTRESRRERLRRLADVPDAHIRIKWESVAVLGVGVVSFAAWLCIFYWMLGEFIDRL